MFFGLIRLLIRNLRINLRHRIIIVEMVVLCNRPYVNNHARIRHVLIPIMPYVRGVSI